MTKSQATPPYTEQTFPTGETYAWKLHMDATESEQTVLSNCPPSHMVISYMVICYMVICYMVICYMVICYKWVQMRLEGLHR